MSVDHASTLHLGILNFNLRVVEDVIIVVDIFDNLNGLILALLFWFRRCISSIVGSMNARIIIGQTLFFPVVVTGRVIIGAIYRMLITLAALLELQIVVLAELLFGTVLFGENDLF